MERKKKNSLNLNLVPSQKFGIVLFVLGIIVFRFRPYQDCSWYEFGCHLGSATYGNIFGLISIILILGAIIFLLKIDKFILE